jgi:hypothetical protein
MAYQKKDPFEGLDREWMDAVVGSSVDDINKRIAELAKAEEENKAAMKADEDLAEKKEAVKFASESYRENTKGYKLRMRWIMQVLADMSKT